MLLPLPPLGLLFLLSLPVLGEVLALELGAGLSNKVRIRPR